ncbi:MAG: hypothetical protein OER21_05745 [Gemmatimonadota bacterium]|nr:hypothetical protein [Gemmatimonadota bacterium]
MRMSRVVRRGLLLVGGVTAAACGGGTEPLPVAASLDLVASTNGQTAPAGARLPLPLAVLARAEGGETVPRTRVRWSVTQGAGAVLSDTVTLADGNGRVEVALVLGPAAGEYRVQAQLVTDAAVVAALTATATPPPTLTSVTPPTFTGGDTLDLVGTALGAAAEVEIGGAPALVLSGSATALSVVVPICLPAGPVEIRARLAGAPSNALPGTYQAAAGPLALAVGEYASIDPAELAGCATFPTAGVGGAEYLLAPQATAGSPGDSAQYRLQGDSVIVTLTARATPGTPLPFAARFHDALRAQEREAAARPRGPMAALSLAPVETPTVKVGDRRTFQVCATLPCSTQADFAAVNARAQYVGVHAALFMDDQAPVQFSAIELDSIGRLFDTDLYEVDTQAFGAESDVDRNGGVIVLFTPKVNGLTPRDQCSTSIITGYFFGIDIDPLFQNDSRSNRGEVFFALAPDPSGTVTCTLSVDVVRRLVPVTFVHEFQHMISYHQHVLVRAGNSEVLWLNEALSHLAEELAGLRFDAQGRNDLFSRFAIGNLFNAYLYLTNPGAEFVLPGSGTGTLEERGAGWLFVRWLLDQHGADLSRRLVETSRTGAENVAAAAGIPFAPLVAQWFLANWVSDLPSFTAPTRLRYTTWRLRTTYSSLNQQLPSQFPRPYPLEPPIFSGGTFAFDGTLRAGSGDYFRVVQSAAQKGFTVRLAAPSGGPLPASVAARLNVIRIR